MDIRANTQETRKTGRFENIYQVSETHTIDPTVVDFKTNSSLRSDNQRPDSERMPTTTPEKIPKVSRSEVVERMGLKNSRQQQEHVFCETEASPIKCRCPWMRHASDFCDWAHRAQREGTYCDFSVKAGSATLRAHSIIIGCHSGLFRRVAQSHLGRCGRVSLRVDNVRPGVLGQLLDYAYTGKIDVNKKNVTEISRAAVDFEMAGILRICLDYTANMDDEQALLILFDSEGIPKSNLIFRRAFGYTLSNFRSVYPDPLFDELSFVMLYNILRHDDLVVCSELEVLDALLKWIHHDFAARKPHFKELVCHVRFCQMEMDQLIYASSISDLLPKYCHKLLIHANWLVTMRHLGYRDPLHLDTGKPRNCLYYQEKTKKGADDGPNEGADKGGTKGSKTINS